MYCKKCKMKIDSKTVICPQCGILLCSKQELMRKNLMPYPEIQKAYETVIFTFKENDFDARAKAMYDNLTVMVDYIYSRCQSPKCEILFSRIEMLYHAKVISLDTYENYLTIINYYNNNEYTTSDEEREVCRILVHELQTFLTDYAKKNYTFVSIGKNRIKDFLFYRMWGTICLLIGICAIYCNLGINNGYNFGGPDVIVGIIFAAMGVGLIAGGKKIAYFILKLRFDIFK